MFASQLLRTRQILPADAEYDPSAFDTADLKVGTNEKQNGVLIHSGGYGKETDSLTSNMEHLQHFNCQGNETDNSVLLKREGDSYRTSSELKHLKAVNHVIEDIDSGARDSPIESDLGEVLSNQLGTKGSQTLTSDEENRDKVLNSKEFELLVALNDCANHDEYELADSGAQIITSKLLQADSTLYTDKSVLDCEVAQLIVCCKDIDCQHVKDICVDRGEPPEEKVLIEKHTDKFVAPHVSKPSIKSWTAETPGLNYEFHIPDGLKSPAQLDFSDPTVDRCDSKEERTIISQELSESEIFQTYRVENSPNSEAFMHSNENNIGSTIEEYVLVEESLVTNMLPLEKFGTRSFHRSSMDSLNSQGEEVPKQSNQSMKANPRSPDRELESEELNQNGADSRDVSYEAREKPWKAEDAPNHDYGNFTNPHAALECANMDERKEEYVLDTEFRNTSNSFLVTEIQSSGKDGSRTDIYHKNLLKNMEGQSSNPFDVEVQSAIVEVSTKEILPTTIVNHKENFNPFAFSEGEAHSIGKDTETFYRGPEESPKRSSSNPFSECEVENAGIDKKCESSDQQPELSNKISGATNPFSVSDTHSSSEVKGIQSTDKQPELSHNGDSYNPFTNPETEGAGIDKIELRDSHNHAGVLKNVSLADPGEIGIGETSFSAASGRITYSGPIAFAGSTSLRSDSSTTSTRSFAFPVLQSEWNSSPVRMKRAERRKQRGGWKHGILCCKF